MTLDLTFGGSLRIPLIAATMFLVSSPEMALAACSRGVMGSFPAHSTRTRAVFAGWLDQMTRGMQELRDQGIEPAPYAVNLVVHRTNERYPGDLELCIQHRVLRHPHFQGRARGRVPADPRLRGSRLPRHRLPAPRAYESHRCQTEISPGVLGGSWASYTKPLLCRVYARSLSASPASVGKTVVE